MFAEDPGEIAGMIVEPVMMNAGIIQPAPGYLEGVRGWSPAHGALLAFDEVKTGLTVGPGGATGLFGVHAGHRSAWRRPWAAACPPRPSAGTTEVMAHVAEGEYEQVGTFNGNPLAMAAARAALTEVLTPTTRTSISPRSGNEW